MSDTAAMKSKTVLTFIGVYGLWLLLMALWAYAALQVQNLVLYLGLLIIQTPSIRPVGWSSETLVGINKCGFLVLVSLWLGLAIFTERYLREGAKEKRLLRNALRLILISGGIYAFSTAILFLLS